MPPETLWRQELERPNLDAVAEELLRSQSTNGWDHERVKLALGSLWHEFMDNRPLAALARITPTHLPDHSRFVLNDPLQVIIIRSYGDFDLSQMRGEQESVLGRLARNSAALTIPPISGSIMWVGENTRGATTEDPRELLGAEGKDWTNLPIPGLQVFTEESTLSSPSEFHLPDLMR